MKISVIGAGALGKTYGGLLSFDHEVHYLVRNDFKAMQQNNSFTLHFSQKEQNLEIKAPLIHQSPQTLPPSDIVIISLKTTENKMIESLLVNCLKPDSIILIIQNGIGNEEWISQFSKECAIVCGISSMGAYREGPTLVEIPIIGELRLAPFNTSKACELMQSLFAKSPIIINSKIFTSYREIRWRKLLWNVPFSSLSIIYKQDSSSLASKSPYVTIVRAVMNEIVEIAHTQGVEITQNDVLKMLELTMGFKEYYPSMFRDYYEGKPIEKEYIIDNVLKIAKEQHINTPMLNMIASHLERSQD